MKNKIFYKYRGFNSCNDHISDIFDHSRLYMSSYKEQNDFEEGDYYFSGDNNDRIRAILEELRNLKSPYRICSMSKNKGLNRLMWGHYANGGNGFLIKFKLGNKEEEFDESKFSLRKVSYSNKFLLNDNEQRQVDRELAEKILSNKHTAWKYENEYRVLTQYESTTYCPITIQKVIFGPKVKMNDIVSHIENLCRSKNIKVLKFNEKF